ncbi:hypothetical protein ES731_09510 [Psychroflexus gondwanensis]|jgi:hypothetical protein|nr:hypothetical protein [Psychroflexus gondwanensis]TXE18749.1 hypothetical protein ES731_09510 [Psychroflexus gondwanensis]
MKRILSLCVIFLSLFISTAQTMEGAWKLTYLDGEAITNREVIKIVKDGYFALGSRDVVDNSFLGAAGGEYRIENEKLIEIRDFDTYDDSKIGIEHQYLMTWVNESRIQLSSASSQKVWERVSVNNDDLDGNWVITGRQRDGEMRTMIPGDRRTIKILGGGRFQWIAFNSATKTFGASGGGTYTAQNGIYTERIRFFSKDKNRVGADLEFDYEVINGEWHHRGNSSKGQSIYEIWSPYQEAYQK